MFTLIGLWKKNRSAKRPWPNALSIGLIKMAAILNYSWFTENACRFTDWLIDWATSSNSNRYGTWRVLLATVSLHWFSAVKLHTHVLSMYPAWFGVFGWRTSDSVHQLVQILSKTHKYRPLWTGTRYSLLQTESSDLRLTVYIDTPTWAFDIRIHHNKLDEKYYVSQVSRSNTNPPW